MQAFTMIPANCTRFSSATRLSNSARHNWQPCCSSRSTASCPSTPSTSGRARQSSLAASTRRPVTHYSPRSVKTEAPGALQSDESLISTSAGSAVQFALNFASVSETYEVHTWMLLLGILKQERCIASLALQDAGLEDLYGAWHEVLWALNVADGIRPKAWQAEVAYCPRAFAVLRSASDFAHWAGRARTESQDILMALAAAGVLEGLFPDANLTFERVRQAVENRVGKPYSLPDDEEGTVTADAAAELIV